ncbi:ER membrane protein complex subunit 10 isoform X2 [Amborella trichopoda]|uniref:ER membrane protein complex subunit 10 n=1 Tax=Amborella trichopoda TaxID=13333 RepID=U5DFT0_AMBTC|nr:ER membrane protein complex subunit 10 isoform X2 [Amborella trichopoda]ERN20327.1 hypothetical protein AMTR_s00066p00191020 [Amborella trichopoda]|eukprot:XP_006858860.1 ER membrane protein complex subunit 10 isoform X2 [Amborella trichopoda]
MRKFAIFCLCILFSVSRSVGFESDELLLDDDEFVSSGKSKLSDLEYLQPMRPSKRGRDFESSSASSSDSKVQFSLEHAFGDGEFLPAGLFTARLKTSPHGRQTLTKLRLSRNTLTDTEKEIFRELLKNDEFYRIRVPSNILNSNGEYTISSVKARCLPLDDLEEHFVIHMDGVKILAVNYGSTGACPYPRSMKQPKKWSFNSFTVLKNSEQAPRTPAFAEELLGGENGEGEGIKPMEKSFWAKYWMYMIPLGLIVMNAFSQAMNMAEPEANGQAPTQGAPAGARVANPGVRRR